MEPLDLIPGLMAAIFGYRFNDELWRLNGQGYPEPLLKLILGRWEQLTIPRVEPEYGASNPSHNADLTPRIARELVH